MLASLKRTGTCTIIITLEYFHRIIIETSKLYDSRNKSARDDHLYVWYRIRLQDCIGHHAVTVICAWLAQTGNGFAYGNAYTAVELVVPLVRQVDAIWPDNCRLGWPETELVIGFKIPFWWRQYFTGKILANFDCDSLFTAIITSIFCRTACSGNNCPRWPV